MKLRLQKGQLIRDNDLDIICAVRQTVIEIGHQCTALVADLLSWRRSL